MEYRQATEQDCGLILHFIKELAIYEHLEDQVVADEATLKKWIFQEKKAEVIFPLVDGKEVGYALYCYNFSTFLGRAGIYVEDVFVEPEYRGRGIGTGIFQFMAQKAVAEGYGRVEWSCLDWNKPSIDFYLGLGAIPMSEWTVYRLTGEKLKRGSGPSLP